MILGVNAFHGDAAACCVGPQGQLLAVAEERFSRVKHAAGLPLRAIEWCLRAARWDPGTRSCVMCVSRSPNRYVARKLALALRHPRSVLRAAGRIKNLRAISDIAGRIEGALPGRDWMLATVVQVEHHLAHIASAFMPSPFEESTCLTVDGFGDFVSSMTAVGRGSTIHVLDRVFYPHSLGLFYTAMTQFLGFPDYGDEYKVMGLAAFGEASRMGEVGALVKGRRGGGVALDLRYFRHLSHGVDMTWVAGRPTLGPVWSERLVELLGPARKPGAPVEQRHRDIAASTQAVYEERFFDLVRVATRRAGVNRLCLAGGCAQNSVANGKLLDRTDVREFFVQPAAGDDGTALGAALYYHHAVQGAPRGAPMKHAYLGPEYGEAECREALCSEMKGLPRGDGIWGEFEVRTALDDHDLTLSTARAISDGEVVGWFQGQAEWGPRALGNRSILADPRRTDMRELLNSKIKRRESFRPFAPSILEEHVGDWFVHSAPDPFMTRVYPIHPAQRSRIPAVTHVDGTGRLQTVAKDANPLYWQLIDAFRERTGVPIVLNTSFNESEPIVNHPREAVACFVRTKMDRLVLGRLIVRRRGVL